MEAVEELQVLAGSVGENDVDEAEIGVRRVGIPRGFAGWRRWGKAYSEKTPMGLWTEAGHPPVR